MINAQDARVILTKKAARWARIRESRATATPDTQDRRATT